MQGMKVPRLQEPRMTPQGKPEPVPWKPGVMRKPMPVSGEPRESMLRWGCLRGAEQGWGRWIGGG